MAMKVIKIEGTEYAVLPNGDLRKVATHYGVSSEVIDNGNGTYSIPTANDPHDPEVFYTKDTQDVYMYEESITAWYKQ